MADHQRAIGRLCNEWADLEIAVAMFFIFVSGMPPGNVSLAICRALSFRDLMAASKVGLISRFENDTWIDRATGELSYIDNQLRNERNRLVHDQWSLESSGPIHMNISPKLYKPQAHMHMHLQIAKIYGPTARQITDLANEIASVAGELNQLTDLISLSDAEIASYLSIPRARLLPRPQRKTQIEGASTSECVNARPNHLIGNLERRPVAV